MQNKKTFAQEVEDAIAVSPQEAARAKRMPLYRVVLINDDYTPMDFVVDVLQEFFDKDKNQAIQIMLTIHMIGKGACGVYTREIAETKVAQVNDYSRSFEYPLLCEMERVS
ncbi:MAG: ATP-dependent Clp protease adapter ClpS [Gammaproteobacteria bacterium]